MHFKVTAQYAGGRELPGEQFNDINQAKAFIDKKMQENTILKVKVIYRLYEWDDLVQEFDSTKMDSSKSSSSSDSSSASSGGKGAGFRPTPLNTAPRPPGTPQKWLKDEDEKDKKK